MKHFLVERRSIMVEQLIVQANDAEEAAARVDAGEGSLTGLRWQERPYASQYCAHELAFRNQPEDPEPEE